MQHGDVVQSGMYAQPFAGVADGMGWPSETYSSLIKLYLSIKRRSLNGIHVVGGGYDLTQAIDCDDAIHM